MIRPLVLVLAWAPAQAGAFDISFPLACTLGEDCFVQQYIDHDTGPGARDFTCGPLSYDGHDGTDFALPSRAAMERGVPVLAAAAGEVLRLRDGVEDNAGSGPPAFPEGQDCGNGLVIGFGQGWEAQYCHLRKGSILVRQGERVAEGQDIALVGQSGNAEFPHLHLTLRKDGKVVDPFAPDLAPDACTAPGKDALWSPSLPYQPGGIVSMGTADHVPSFGAVKDGTAATPVTATSPALVLWVQVFGTREGDRLEMTIIGPDGPFAEKTEIFDRTQARAFRAIGRKIADRPRWPAGQYRAEAVLERGGGAVDRMDTTFRVP